MKELSLEYKLIRNHLQNGKSFSPRAINQKTVRYENVLKEMEHNTAIRSADLQLAMNQFMNTVTDILARGMKAETPLGVFSVVLQGRLNSIGEEFRPGAPDTNHRIRLQWISSAGMKKNVAHNLVLVKNMDNLHPVPKAVSIRNMSKPNLKNFVPKDVLEIKGMNLKINTDDDEQGIFWIDADKRSFKNKTIVESIPSKLVFQVPDLPPGVYALETHNIFAGKVLRHTNLFKELTVCEV
ncbi:MAG: DUF4469 domain-containing protein [Spirochaetales bacterium]|nr:DUF4469 domain-containing protein [Spirochaetales bacterium]